MSNVTRAIRPNFPKSSPFNLMQQKQMLERNESTTQHIRSAVRKAINYKTPEYLLIELLQHYASNTTDLSRLETQLAHGKANQLTVLLSVSRMRISAGVIFAALNSNNHTIIKLITLKLYAKCKKDINIFVQTLLPLEITNTHMQLLIAIALGQN